MNDGSGLVYNNRGRLCAACRRLVFSIYTLQYMQFIFIERLIETVRRKCLDQLLFWNSIEKHPRFLNSLPKEKNSYH